MLAGNSLKMCVGAGFEINQTLVFTTKSLKKEQILEFTIQYPYVIFESTLPAVGM